MRLGGAPKKRARNSASHIPSATTQAAPSRRRQIGAPGFEPGTSPTRTVRATRLRHAPKAQSLAVAVTTWRGQPALLLADLEHGQERLLRHLDPAHLLHPLLAGLLLLEE